MNLQHIKQTVEVAKAGSLSKASEVLLIAAPNISRSIKELEADLGITIFDRTQNGMKLTPDTYMEAVRAVTAEQVSEVARLLKLNTTYFLKGASQ